MHGVCSVTLALAALCSACDSTPATSMPSPDSSTGLDAGTPDAGSCPELPQLGQLARCPARVLTWGYDGAYGGVTAGTTSTATTPAARALIQQWLSFAEGGSNEKAALDCGPKPGSCIPIGYVDPSNIFIPQPSRTSASDFTSGCADFPDTTFYDLMYNPDVTEAWLLHEPGFSDVSHRIVSNTGADHRWCAGTMAADVYFPSRGNAAVQSWYRTYFNKYFDSDYSRTAGFGYWMMHDNMDLAGVYLYSPTGFRSANEVPDDGVLATASASFLDALAHTDGSPIRVVANALAARNGPSGIYADPTAIYSQNQLHNLWGMISEQEIAINQYIYPEKFFVELNTQSIVLSASPPEGYVLLNTSNAPAGSTTACNIGTSPPSGCGQLQQRRLHTAILWLGFKEGYSVTWENMSSSDRTILAVYPEAILYPADPVQTMRKISIPMAGPVAVNGSGCRANGVFDDSFTGGARDLAVACGTYGSGAAAGPTGVYRREFARCFKAGVAIGPCAVILNGTAQPRPVSPGWLTRAYGHVIAWAGGDVLAAGCGDGDCPKAALDLASAPFVPSTTTIPPYDALFLAP